MSTSLRLLPHSAPSNNVAPDSLHPWFRALEAFRVPYVCYSRDMGRRRTSAAATMLLASASGAVIELQADKVAGAQLRTLTPQLHVGQFVHTCTVPTHAGFSLSVFVVWPELPDVAAVVVFTPLAAARSFAESGLTRREAEVAELVRAGLATKEVAATLGVSVHTARHHTERVFAKLGVRSRAALAALTGGSTSQRR